MKWYIGCSGFHYKEWKGSFYPDTLSQREWFNYYTKQFNSLELNVTFYRFPQLTTLKGWFEKSPAQFLFSVKAPRLITHYKEFNGTGKLLEDFYTTILEGLREKLGAVLFQLPPKAIFTKEYLRRIIQNMNSSFNNVIEFRHPSWWQREVIETLTDHNITFCSISYPGLPDETIVNNSLLYYRFHGTPLLYKSAYKDEKLKQIIADINKQKFARNIFLYFNNTASAAALKNAFYIQDLIVEK